MGLLICLPHVNHQNRQKVSISLIIGSGSEVLPLCARKKSHFLIKSNSKQKFILGHCINCKLKVDKQDITHNVQSTSDICQKFTCWFLSVVRTSPYLMNLKKFSITTLMFSQRENAHLYWQTWPGWAYQVNGCIQ